MKNKIITQCSYCGQIQNDNGKYDGIKRPIIKTGNVSHGICQECFEIEIKKIEEKR